MSIWSLSSFWTQFFHPVMFQGDLGRRPRWRIYFLVHDFSSFHPNNFRNTISRECFVNNDSFRSSLIELQSFLQSNIDVYPKNCVMMFLPCFMHVLCMTRWIQVDRTRILMVFVHGIHRQKEYCLFVAQIFDLQVSIPNWWWNVNWLHMRHDKSMRLRPEWLWRACVGEGLVSWPHLLGEVAHWILLLNLGEVEG